MTPQVLPILAFPDRRSTLEAWVSVGDLFRRKMEVVWTGLEREPFCTELRQRICRRKVHNMNTTPILSAQIPHQPDGRVLPGPGSRCQIGSVASTDRRGGR